MPLPKFIALRKTNGSQVRYLGNIDNTDSASKRFLAYNVDNAMNSLARFEIETVEDDLVQVRSCFTNKLWSRSSPTENWIVSSSSEEIKDKSNWGCTLFKPTIEGTNVTFTHVQLQRTLVLQKLDHETAVECLCVDSDDTSVEVVVATFIDLTSLVTLPKYVTFKADNINFLDAIVFEVVPHHDGSVGFKCVKSDQILGVSETDNSLLLIESDIYKENDEMPICRFNPIKVFSGRVISIVLQSVYNSKYLKLDTLSDNLFALSPSIEDSEKMEVIEPVSNRTVEVTRLRTEDFIFLSRSCYTMDTKIVEHDQMVALKSESLETMEWSKSVSLVTDLSFSIRSPTPYYDPTRNCFVSSDNIYKAEDYTWGTKKIFKFPVRQSIPIMVPPGEKIVVRLMARSVRFQIPFDYTQTDTLTFNGGTKTYTNLRDGLYNGEFFSDFYVEAENEKM